MKTKILLGALVCVLVCQTGSFAADFEGKISRREIFVYSHEFENTDTFSRADVFLSKSIEELKQMAAQTGEDEAYSEESADIYLKGDVFLINTLQDGQDTTIIFDSPSATITTLMHEDKTALVMDMNQMGKMNEQMMEEMNPAPEMMEEKDLFSMEPAGKTRTINGFACELYKGVDSEGDYSRMWIHKGYADVFHTMVTAFSKLDAGEDAPVDKEEQFFRKIKGIPILTKTISMDELIIDEIREISRQSVPEKMFAVPKEYKKMNMQEMMQQMMQQ